MTNPALNLILAAAVHFLGTTAYAPVLLILELAAVSIEAYVLKLLCRFSSGKAVAVSLLMNLVSCMAGISVYLLL